MPNEKAEIIENKYEHSADEDLKSELNANESMPASSARQEDLALDQLDMAKIG